MKIRDFANANDHQIIGKLTYVGIIDHARMYIDEAGNEYYRDTITDTLCIVTVDGAVI
jgi:hypothetical protein